MTMDGRKIYTVSELNQEIRIVLEDTWGDVWLAGEVSNFRDYSSGHWYFSLKDADALISVVMFAGANRHVRFTIEDGLKIIVRGRVSAYPKRGEYQFVVTAAEPSGKGALQLAFEQLKVRLEKEGLFDQSRKRPIPMLPQRIGIVTSPTGAAIRDMLSVIGRRFANVGILLYPVRVQGAEAKTEIAEGIRFLNDAYPTLDVLLVGRGGGSYEDLWAFNEEIVVRAIAGSRIPVISCVGHEIDYTLTDFAADLRAPTPSAAAELVVRSKVDLLQRLSGLDQRLRARITHLLESYHERLAGMARSRFLQDPLAVFERRMQSLDMLRGNLEGSMARILERSRLVSTAAMEKLHLLSPMKTLERGFSICWKLPDRSLVTDAADVATFDELEVRVAQGSIKARVQ